MPGSWTKNTRVRSASIIALGVVALASVSCGSDDVDQAVPPEVVAPTREADSIDAAAIAGLLLPRPTTVDRLVETPDVIMIGQVSALIGNREIGPYGKDGLILPPGDSPIAVTDFAISIERVLKSDGIVEGFGLVTLRMPGHGPPETGFALSISAILPEVGERLLFLLEANPDGTYGAGDEGLIILDADAVTFHDGATFGEGIGADDLLAEIEKLISG